MTPGTLAVLRAIIWLVAVVLALVVLVRWIEPRFAFFPSGGETTTPAEFGVEFSAMSIDARDGERLHAWLLRSPSPRARIVYFHGNGGNLSIWAPILSDIARHVYDILAVDYRGYGLSTGRPSENGHDPEICRCRFRVRHLFRPDRSRSGALVPDRRACWPLT